MTTSYQAPELDGQSVMGDDAGQLKSRLGTTMRERTTRTLAPAAPALFRSSRNGSCCPSSSNSVLDSVDVAVARVHPDSIGCWGGNASGARTDEDTRPLRGQRRRAARAQDQNQKRTPSCERNTTTLGHSFPP